MAGYGGVDRGQRAMDGCDGVRVAGFGGHALLLLHLLWMQHLEGSGSKSLIFNFFFFFWLYLLFWNLDYCL